MSDPPSERRSTLRFAVVIAIGTLVLLELGLRVFSRSDVDGNVWVGPLRVLPYRVPIEDVRARGDTGSGYSRGAHASGRANLRRALSARGFGLSLADQAPCSAHR